MSVAVDQAMEQALACHRVPSLLASTQVRPLPEGMMTLLRLAGGDQAMASLCAEASGETEQEVVSAAVFFIQQVMFAPGADSYRVLGVEAGAPDDRIKEHYRWLVRWLHPDRNTDDWDSVYADRVNVAWQDLRSPVRRRAYDDSRLAGAAPAYDDFGEASALDREPVRESRPGPVNVGPVPAIVNEPPVRISAATAQKLPAFVLGGLGGAAVMLLFLLWLASDPHDLQGGQGGQVANGSPAMPQPPAVEDRPDAIAQAQLAASAPAPQIASAVATAPSPAALPPAAPPNASPVASTLRPAPTPPAAAPVAAATAARARAPAVARAVSPAAIAPAATATTGTGTGTPLAAPTPAPAAQPAPAAIAHALSEAQGHALLRGFSDAYRAGDVSRLMRLFTSDARNNRGGREAIVYDYQSLFSASQSRDLHLEPSGWLQREDGATLIASYEARVQTPGRRRDEVSRGSIRFDLRLENGEPRISLVHHD